MYALLLSLDVSLPRRQPLPETAGALMKELLLASAGWPSELEAGLKNMPSDTCDKNSMNTESWGAAISDSRKDLLLLISVGSMSGIIFWKYESTTVTAGLLCGCRRRAS